MEGPAFKNAVTFAPHSGTKVPAPLPGSLAQQGFQGIRFHARRAAAPSRSPAPVQAGAFKLRFFDTLRWPAAQPQAIFCRIKCTQPLTGANRARARPARSAGDSSTWKPIFPALTTMASRPWALSSMTVLNCFFIPTGEQPPWT